MISSMQRSQKISVSVPTSLVQFLERYQLEHGLKTKSSVVERALQALREQELEREYAAAAREQHETGEAEDWEITAGDGMAAEAWK